MTYLLNNDSRTISFVKLGTPAHRPRKYNLIVFHIFIHHRMRIFNPNAPAIFSGPVLGRSAEPFEFILRVFYTWTVPELLLISLSNLNRFSHIYTSSDAYFQSECTGNIFGAGLRPVCRCAEPFQFIQRCSTHNRCRNCCLISLSNLNRFSHIYTSSDAYFQSECTGSNFWGRS